MTLMISAFGRMWSSMTPGRRSANDAAPGTEPRCSDSELMTMTLVGNVAAGRWNGTAESKPITRTFWGLCTRLYSKLSAYTLCIYLNCILGNPDFLQIKSLAFPN